MAIGKARESVEAVDIKRYIGVGAMFVRGVNPDKQEMEKFYGREQEKEPEYLGSFEDNGTQIPSVRVSFLVELDTSVKDKNGNPKYGDITEFKSTVTFFIRKRFRYSKDGKIQVIDKFGYSGWATKEELQNHAQLVSSKGNPLRITTAYRPAYEGETELVDFIKTYLNFDEAKVWIDGKWVKNPKVEDINDCEVFLEEIENYFKGNYSELKKIAKMMPTNKIKVMFGIRTDNEGKQFQTAFTRLFMKNHASDYSEFDKQYQEAKNNGAFSTTEFEAVDLHEYNIQATDLSAAPEVTQDPFSSMDTPFS